LGFFGGSANGTNQKRSNLVHERSIGWKTNGIPKVFFLQILVDAGIGKGGIASKVAVDLFATITGYNRIEYGLPVLGTMHIALSEQNSLHVTKLIETKKRMISGAGKMSVVGAALLFATQPPVWKKN
jgi:hypothetical protein